MKTVARRKVARPTEPTTGDLFAARAPELPSALLLLPASERAVAPSPDAPKPLFEPRGLSLDTSFVHRDVRYTLWATSRNERRETMTQYDPRTRRQRVVYALQVIVQRASTVFPRGWGPHQETVTRWVSIADMTTERVTVDSVALAEPVYYFRPDAAVPELADAAIEAIDALLGVRVYVVSAAPPRYGRSDHESLFVTLAVNGKSATATAERRGGTWSILHGPFFSGGTSHDDRQSARVAFRRWEASMNNTTPMITKRNGAFEDDPLLISAQEERISGYLIWLERSANRPGRRYLFFRSRVRGGVSNPIILDAAAETRRHLPNAQTTALDVTPGDISLWIDPHPAALSNAALLDLAWQSLAEAVRARGHETFVRWDARPEPPIVQDITPPPYEAPAPVQVVPAKPRPPAGRRAARAPVPATGDLLAWRPPSKPNGTPKHEAAPRATVETFAATYTIRFREQGGQIMAEVIAVAPKLKGNIAHMLRGMRGINTHVDAIGDAVPFMLAQIRHVEGEHLASFDENFEPEVTKSGLARATVEVWERILDRLSEAWEALAESIQQANRHQRNASESRAAFERRMAPELARVGETLATYRRHLEAARRFAERVFEGADALYDEQSETWQESERGQEFADFRDTWEGLKAIEEPAVEREEPEDPDDLGELDLHEPEELLPDFQEAPTRARPDD